LSNGTRGLKQVQQVPSIEPIQLKYLYYSGCSLSEAIGPLEVMNKKIGAQGHPDLSEDCVFAGTDERLNLQVLLYPLEE
jgi:hypothetical protein